MEFKGTKGKWLLVNDFNNLESEKGESIASFHWNYEDYHTTMVKNEIEGKHNALLISKAPEMLEMLEKLVNTYELLGLSNEVKQLIKEATEL